MSKNDEIKFFNLEKAIDQELSEERKELLKEVIKLVNEKISNQPTATGNDVRNYIKRLLESDDFKKEIRQTNGFETIDIHNWISLNKLSQILIEFERNNNVFFDITSWWNMREEISRNKESKSYFKVTSLEIDHNNLNLIINNNYSIPYYPIFEQESNSLMNSYHSFTKADHIFASRVKKQKEYIEQYEKSKLLENK